MFLRFDFHISVRFNQRNCRALAERMVFAVAQSRIISAGQRRKKLMKVPVWLVYPGNVQWQNSRSFGILWISVIFEATRTSFRNENSAY